MRDGVHFFSIYRKFKFNTRTMRLIDIMEQKGSFAVVVCDGNAKLTKLPVHGETKIVTYPGKVKQWQT